MLQALHLAPLGFCYILASSNISSARVDVTARPFPNMVSVSHFTILSYEPHASPSKTADPFGRYCEP